MSEEDEESFSYIFRESMDGNTDCNSCRLVSSMGLGLSGLYLFHHRNNFGKVNAYIQTTLSAGLLALCLIRGMGLPPFTRRSVWQGMDYLEKKYGSDSTGDHPEPPVSKTQP